MKSRADEPEFSPAGKDEVSTLVEQWMAAFNTHDVRRITELYTEDAELFDTGMRRIRRGRDEITAWFTQRFHQIPAIQYIPTRLFFQENEAAVCWQAQGQTPAFLRQHWLSRSFQIDGVSIFRVRSCRIFWQRGYYDHLQVAERVLPPLRWLPLKL